MKITTTTRRMVHSGADMGIQHRECVTSCPNCRHQPPDQYNWWRKNAETLVLYPAHWKTGNVALITECPKCFEKSWIHEPMDNFRPYNTDVFPIEWIKKVEEILAQIRLDALREWAFGLCGRCKHLESGTVNERTWRYCDKIHGGSAVMECDLFEEIEKKKIRLK